MLSNCNCPRHQRLSTRTRSLEHCIRFSLAPVAATPAAIFRPVMASVANEDSNVVPDANNLRSQIYFGDLGALTDAEKAALKAKEQAAKAAVAAKRIMALFSKAEDMHLPWASATVPRKQSGGFYSAAEIPPVPSCPNLSEFHVCTEYCNRRYSSAIDKSKFCAVM